MLTLLREIRDILEGRFGGQHLSRVPPTSAQPEEAPQNFTEPWKMHVDHGVAPPIDARSWEWQHNDA